MTAHLTSYQTQTLHFFRPQTPRKKPYLFPLKFQHKTHKTKPTQTQGDDGIPYDDVKLLVKFRSRHNYIRVLQVSRDADHPLARSRLLLLDQPGNIHSIYFFSKTLTGAYYDVFATLPPIIPPGPVGLLGLGGGSAARSILRLYPSVAIHGWEIDPAVVDVARVYFGLGKLEKKFPDRLFIHVGDALKASSRDGFAGVVVDLFSKGSLVPELQDVGTWRALRSCLRKGGRLMVNVGGSCVEAEETGRDGRVVMEETLVAMSRVFGDQLFVLSLGNGRDDSSVALTGHLPDLDDWKKKLPKGLAGYADMWMPFRG